MLNRRFKKKLSILMSALLIFSLFLPVDISIAEGNQDDYSVQFLYEGEANYQGLPVGAIVTTTTSGVIALELLDYSFELEGNTISGDEIEVINSWNDQVELLGFLTKRILRKDITYLL